MCAIGLTPDNRQIHVFLIHLHNNLPANDLI